MDIGFVFRLQDTDFQYLDQYLINICPPNQLHPTGYYIVNLDKLAY